MSIRPAGIVRIQRPGAGHACPAGQQPDLGALADVVWAAHGDSYHALALLASYAPFCGL